MIQNAACVLVDRPALLFRMPDDGVDAPVEKRPGDLLRVVNMPALFPCERRGLAAIGESIKLVASVAPPRQIRQHASVCSKAPACLCPCRRSTA
jgi:hypothetical protein